MQQKLMVENIDNLQDARYCAAIGASLLTFHMDATRQGALSARAVAEILQWLEGVEGYGHLGGDPAAAASEAKEAGLSGVVCEADAASSFGGLSLVLDCTTLEENAIPAVSAGHGSALLLLTTAQFVNLRDALHGARCIVRIDAPGDLHSLLAVGDGPVAISLGAFARTADGELDYDACDAFAHQHLGTIIA